MIRPSTPGRSCANNSFSELNDKVLAATAPRCGYPASGTRSPAVPGNRVFEGGGEGVRGDVLHQRLTGHQRADAAAQLIADFQGHKVARGGRRFPGSRPVHLQRLTVSQAVPDRGRATSSKAARSGFDSVSMEDTAPYPTT